MANDPRIKQYGKSWLFDPEQGHTVIAPAGSGSGNWAGAPSIVYDSESGRFYLSYRVRKPRPVRGGEAHIAESTDGVHFETIWSCTKEQLGSESVERFCLTKKPDGTWLLYPSYVDPEDKRWCIDVIQAARPGEFQVENATRVLTAGDAGVEGVKDPWVMQIDGVYYMLISYATGLGALSEQQERTLHATGDIYNTGLTLSSSGLAVSLDGLHYHWLGDIFPPSVEGWDRYAARLGCLLRTEHGWVGYYDGSASVEGNYEERTGIAHGMDLRNMQRLSFEGPALVSPHGSGSLRYIDVVPFEREVLFYYEYCRPDGSHELRMNRVPR
jgi:hypothetical protein